jgi:hypothetical protein
MSSTLCALGHTGRRVRPYCCRWHESKEFTGVVIGVSGMLHDKSRRSFGLPLIIRYSWNDWSLKTNKLPVVLRTSTLFRSRVGHQARRSRLPPLLPESDR